MAVLQSLNRVGHSWSCCALTYFGLQLARCSALGEAAADVQAPSRRPAPAEPWHDPRPGWAEARLRQFLAETPGDSRRVRAAVDRVLDPRLDLMDTAVDDVLRAWVPGPRWA